MGAGHSTPPIKDRLKQAFDHLSTRKRRGTNPLQDDEIATQPIPQETAPIARASSPLASAELDGSGAVGPTFEEILSDAVDIFGEPFTMSSIPWRSTVPESHRSDNIQSPAESSQSLANRLGNISMLESTPENAAHGIAVNEQITIKPFAPYIFSLSPPGDGPRHISDPLACVFCETLYSDYQERRVWLPCGHSFGISCLHHWFETAIGIFQSRGISLVHLRCPHDCISLRYRCGHLVMPRTSAPDPVYTDTSAVAIPSDYEFCKTENGAKLIKAVNRLQNIENHLVGDPAAHSVVGGRRRTALDVLLLRRPPFSEKLLSMVQKLRLKAESRLSHEHQTWWLREWDMNGHSQMNTSSFTTDYQTEVILRRDFLQELSNP
ncbi:hypothetical protein ACQKWADRAFT_292359 [Trichoderma austrokoningii]